METYWKCNSIMIPHVIVTEIVLIFIIFILLLLLFLNSGGGLTMFP